MGKGKKAKRKRPATQSQARASLARSKSKSNAHPILLKKFIEQNRPRLSAAPSKATGAVDNANARASPDKRSPLRKKQKTFVVSSSRSLSPRGSNDPVTRLGQPRSPSEPPKPNHARSRAGSSVQLIPPPSRPRNPSVAHSEFSAHSLAESLISLPPMPETPSRGNDDEKHGDLHRRAPSNHGRSRSSDRRPQNRCADDLRSTVVYLNGVRERYDDQALKRELDRVFPGISCRASCVSNGGILLKEFKRREDIDKVASLKWEAKIGGTLPFGGVDNAKISKLSPKAVVMRTARLVVHKDSRSEWVRERLLEEGWGECEVTEVGDPFNGLRTLRIVLPTHDLLDDFVSTGFRLGSERLSPVPWRTHQAARLCDNCWKRHVRKGKCNAPRRCRLCGGDCRRNECRARKAKCPNCCLPHAATSVFCSYKQALMRKFSKKTGLPLPLFVESVSKADRKPPEPVNVEHPSRNDGRSYVSVSDKNRPPNGLPQVRVQQPRALAPSGVGQAGKAPCSSADNQAHRAPDGNQFYHVLEATLSKALAPLVESISALTAKVDSMEQRYRPKPSLDSLPDHNRKVLPLSDSAERRSSDPRANGRAQSQQQRCTSAEVSPELFLTSLQKALSPVLQSVQSLSKSMSRMEKSRNNG